MRSSTAPTPADTEAGRTERIDVLLKTVRAAHAASTTAELHEATRLALATAAPMLTDASVAKIIRALGPSHDSLFKPTDWVPKDAERRAKYREIMCSLDPAANPRAAMKATGERRKRKRTLDDEGDEDMVFKVPFMYAKMNDHEIDIKNRSRHVLTPIERMCRYLQESTPDAFPGAKFDRVESGHIHPGMPMARDAGIVFNEEGRGLVEAAFAQCIAMLSVTE